MSVAHTKRICQIIKLKPETVAEYKSIHAAVWPSVLAALERHHIVDYSIHHYPPLQLLVANFKYTGSDFDKDMQEIAADEETQRWWKVTDGMQESFEVGATGSGKEVPWWTELEEVFRFEGSSS
ncbi:rhamnose mutarotase [Cristinia sonorae]|uniref:Rhamnose mutarotase n=1 Tax=Cristinia sonorae TaxID=1940300 RepID=A0A8K0UTA9_9AGAR|nr:rhamnose mutarotase [Cristinia sonorae]